MTRKLGPVLATGVGSLPGTDVREWVRVLLGELSAPYLPELPARGPGSDMVGRGLGLLVDIAAEWGPRGWILSNRPGVDQRRGQAALREDLDVVEELAGDWDGWFKIQVCGPWTMLAQSELPSGHRAVRDEGAVRDVVQSLADGLDRHVADVRRRLPSASIVVIVDEPSLPSVLEGSLPTPSGRGRVAAVEPATVQAALTSVLLAAFGHGVGVGVHCCASNPPIELIWQAGAGALSVDLLALGTSADDELGSALEAGVILMAGVVPSVGGAAGPSDVGATVAVVTDLFDRLGMSVREHEVAVTPTCGLAGADPAYARMATHRCAEAATRLDDADE